MANKYKYNPITGKFDIVGDGEDTPMSVTSSDHTVNVTETAEGVDLGVNVNEGQLKTEFDTLHEIYNKYKRRPSGDIDTEGIEKHWIFPQDVRLSGGVNLPMYSGSSQYGDWLLVAICTSGNNGAVDTEGRITLNSFSISPDTDPQLNSSVQFPLLDFRWRLLRGENTTEPDNGVPPHLFISNLVYEPTSYKECKGRTVGQSAPTWSFDPEYDFMCVCHKVTSTEYGTSKFTANAGYSYVYYVFLRHKIYHCFYLSLEYNRIVTGKPVQCTFWTNNYHYNAAMGSPATAVWSDVMKTPTWTYSSQVNTELAHWCQYCDRSANRGQFRDILCQTLFGETAGNGVTALPTGTRVMAKVSSSATELVTSWNETPTDEAAPSEKLVKQSLEGKSNTDHTHSNYAVDNALATNADLDSIVKPGFYYVGGGNTCTHVASTAGNPFGLVVIHTAAGAYYTQIFFDYWGKTYKRVKGYKGNTEWSAWVELQADWNETDTYSPAYIKNKPSVLNDLETRLSSIESRLAALE